jgi:hypothetical protein
MAFTYLEANLTADSAAGRLARVRLYLQDTTNSPTAARFTDAEIEAFLDVAEDNEYEAAASALEAYAARLSLYPTSESGSNYSITRQQVASLTAYAATLRAQGSGGGLQTATIYIGTPNEYLDSMRPQWPDVNDLPVLE